MRHERDLRFHVAKPVEAEHRRRVIEPRLRLVTLLTSSRIKRLGVEHTEGGRRANTQSTLMRQEVR